MQITRLLLILVIAGMGCGDNLPTSPPDAGRFDGLPRPDGGGDQDSEVPLTLPPGGTGHAQVGAVLATGQVRAGKVTAADQLLPGIKATGQVGDFKIYNDRVAFIIADARAVVDGFAPYGGKILEASKLQAGGAAGKSLLGELIFGVGVQVMRPRSVGVVNDGSDGKPAVIRVLGEPGPFPMLASLLGNLAEPAPIWLAIEYQLAADSDTLEIRWRLFNRKRVDLTLPALALGVTAGDGADIFADEVGFAMDKAFGPQAWLGVVGRPVAYGLQSPEQPLSPLIYKSGIWVLTSTGMKLAPAGEGQRLYRLAITDGGPEAVRRAMRGLLGQPEPLAVSGVVRSGGAPLAEARVHVERDDPTPRYLSMSQTDAAGAYRLALGPGSYRLTVVADGRPVPPPVPVKIEAAAVKTDLEVPLAARLSCTVTDELGKKVPAKLIFKTKSLPNLPAAFGEPSWPGSSIVRFTATGSEEIDLPAGSYLAYASRGFEHEIQELPVTVAEGEKKSLAFQLRRSVSTPGYLAGDFHIHAMWSPDSSDLYEDKAAAMAAEGLEIPVLTEHEYIGDLAPAVAKLGLQPYVRVFSGEEITPFLSGHFNAFPLPPDPAKPNRGAIQWYGKTMPAMFAEVHATWPEAVLQVNHPRWTGYFNWVGYDAATGTATKLPLQWSRLFEAVEVFNGSGWSTNQSLTVPDWYSFLDRGLLVTATGNSDSHHCVWDSLGYPRNYVKLSTDQPANVNPSELARAVREGRVVVSGGPFISASVGSKSLGDVVDATAKKVTLTVAVQAPAWVPVDRLRVIVGGQVVIEQPIDASTVDPKNPALRLQKDLAVLVERDSWMIVLVTGPGTLDPVYRGKEPFAVTNPIYLDVDGNGVYDPPKGF